MTNPCGECPKKGCGAYHDRCEKYQEWREASRAETIKQRELAFVGGRSGWRMTGYKCKTFY